MSGLVLELQRDALDKEVDVSDLLRKAMVVSRKLRINEISDWISNELSGYPNNEDLIPEYREVRGQIKVFNPYRGWQPLNFSNAELGEELSKRKISQAIGEIGKLANSGDGSYLHVPFSQASKNFLMSRMDIALEPTLLVGSPVLHGILDHVRNAVLDWALDLESRGIVGDGMSFSLQEKSTASQVTYQITNNIGSMQNSQIQQDSQGASQVQNITLEQADIMRFLDAIKSARDDLGLDQDSKDELDTEIATIELQLASPKPKNSIITESLKSTRNILEGITGSIIATGLLAQLSALM